MLTFRRLRRLVASCSLVLLCLAAQAPAFARTQEANLIRFNTETVLDLPSGVRGDLTLANDGNIYFMSSTGGTASYGAIGKLTPAGVLSTLYSFPNTDAGAKPYAGLMQANDGNLYGTTYLGGVDGAGALFRVSLTGDYAVLHSFGATKTDAALPYTGLVQASDGNLYGTTLRGGVNDKGTIYKITLAGVFSILHSFAGDDGENPEGKLIIGSDGELYGTTLQGGSANRGTLYRISTTGTLTSLYSFPRLSAFSNGVATNATGANPRAAMMLAADGNYYGTTYQGGPNGYGTVYRMTPAGVVTVFHAFTGPVLGAAFSLGGLVQDSAGNIYGSSYFGGYLDVGSVWRLDTSGQFALMHGFFDLGTDGSNPQTSLLLANGGLYGVSSADGLLGRGVLFKLDLGSNGVLPVEVSVSPTEIVRGSTATITWSSPTAATCTASGGLTSGSVANSGTLSVTPTGIGTYTYVLSCTDGAGVVRTAHTALVVKSPPLETVDGGGGAGALSVPLLLLLAALLFRKNLKEIFTACP